jgi:hypothetical protein
VCINHSPKVGIPVCDAEPSKRRVRVGQVQAFNLGYALGRSWALEDGASEDSAAAGSPAPVGVGSAAAASTRAES